MCIILQIKDVCSHVTDFNYLQEFFAKKTDASLFLFGSHNKKRPNNLVLGEPSFDML